MSDHPAVKALLSYQQADMDGVMVLVSRQAIHEVVDRIEALEELVRYAFNEGFGQGMRENSSYRGGYSWHESKAKMKLSGSETGEG